MHGNSSLLKAINSGDFETADSLLSDMYRGNYDSVEIIEAKKCLRYWHMREERLANIPTPFQKAEYLITEWKDAECYIKERQCDESIQFAFKQYVFSRVLAELEEYKGEQKDNDPEVLFMIAHSHKALGNYEKSLKILRELTQKYKDSGRYLAQLADVYSLIGEDKIAKAMFREAFFISPDKINLVYLESEMIALLVTKVRELGYNEENMTEWIPVYGALFHVFNVKRELRAIEYGKLKQSIYSLEVKVREQKGEAEDQPRLMNKYFWLIDHYLAVNADQSKLDEVLLKIRQLNPYIYQQYIK